MLRLLALQDENTFRQIAKHPDRVQMPKQQTTGVPLSVLDPAQGIIVDSAPARLTADIASRSGQPCAPLTRGIRAVQCASPPGSGRHCPWSAQSLLVHHLSGLLNWCAC